MALPSRVEIRRWLVENSRAEIETFLEDIRAEHGHENEKEIRHFLNIDRKLRYLDSPAEITLITEREEIRASNAVRNKL